MNPGVAAAVAAIMATNAARRRREELARLTELEQERYEGTMDRLEDIIKAGKDVQVMTVLTNVGELPKRKGSFFERLFGLRKHYQKLDEGSADYLQRAFHSFSTHEGTDFIVLGKKELSLYFIPERMPILYERKSVVVFSPEYTENQEVAREMEIRTHNTELKFWKYDLVGGYKALPTKKLAPTNFISKPEKDGPFR